MAYREKLLDLLLKYSSDKAATCDFNCYHCRLGVLAAVADDISCSIKIVMRSIEEELEVTE